MLRAFGFRDSGIQRFRGWGFRDLGFRVQDFCGLVFKNLGIWGLDI